MKLILDKPATDRLLRALGAEDRPRALSFLEFLEREGRVVAVPIPQALGFRTTFATQLDPDICVEEENVNTVSVELAAWLNVTEVLLPTWWYLTWVWRRDAEPATAQEAPVTTCPVCPVEGP